VSLGVTVALLGALTGAIVTACYEVPRPDCGFICGPEDACPDGYTCAGDHRCRRIGAPAMLVCPNPDANLPDGRDAAIDVRSEALPDAVPDATPDAPPDATPDAPLDAMPDAPPDAMPDAPGVFSVKRPPSQAEHLVRRGAISGGSAR